MVSRFPGFHLEYCEREGPGAPTPSPGTGDGHKASMTGRRSSVAGPACTTPSSGVFPCSSSRTTGRPWNRPAVRCSPRKGGNAPRPRRSEAGNSFVSIMAATCSPAVRDPPAPGSSTSGGGFYRGKHGTTRCSAHLVVGGTRYSTDLQVVLVDIIVEEQLATDRIRIDADWMREGWRLKVGWTFRTSCWITDSDRLQGGFLPLLKEVATLLVNMPDIKLFVVGHTDMTGGLEHNLGLSRRRAAEWSGRWWRSMTSIQARSGMAAVLHHGREPQRGAGRQKNRRVTLVARP